MSEILHPALAGKDIKPGTPEAFIAVAQFYASQKYVEKPKNSNHTMFGAWYGVQTAWCAMFVSYCLNHSGNGSTINGAQSKKGFALCSKGIAWFKKKNAWYPVGKAQPGDVAFFDWNHDHSPEHTGLIIKVDLKKKRVLTIEGNTGAKNLSNGGAVMKQWRNMSTIMGIGRPAWPANKIVATTMPVAPPAVAPVAPPVAPQPVVEAPKPTTTPITPATPKPGLQIALKLGSTGSAVKYLQHSLGLNPDGDFGPNTKAAVMRFQAAHHLVADGIVGPKTWALIK